MLIRSQDKGTVTDCINLWIDDEIGVEFNIESREVGTLGTYSTKEKAMKVLDMIQEEYQKHLYSSGGPLALVDGYVQAFAFIPPKVFQMPQDSEVEE